MHGCCSLVYKAQKQAACRDDAHWLTLAAWAEGYST